MPAENFPCLLTRECDSAPYGRVALAVFKLFRNKNKAKGASIPIFRAIN
jgi:hypothetical protein